MTVIYEKYLSRVNALPDRCAFRGQANSAWELHSSATRRLIKHYNNDENITESVHFSRIYMIYHRVALLEPARTNGFGIDDGHRISDLQLLAKLQHFGAATGLIDFTRDPLVALWFACESYKDQEGQECNGRVYAIDLNDPTQFQKVSSEEEVQSAEEIFSPSGASERQFYWEAMIRGEASPRVIRQQSVFVIGRPIVPEDAITSIEIEASEKNEILKELEATFNIDRHSLFVDVHGFSMANSVKSSLKNLESSVNYLIQGNQFYQQGDFGKAVSNYDRCIQLDIDVSEPYFLRGNAKTELEDYSGAKLDFDLAIQYKDRPNHHWKQRGARVTNPHILWPLFFNRGNVKAELTDYEGAKADYDEAIRLCQQVHLANPSLFFNRGNARAMLHNFEKAIDDFSEAISLGLEGAHFNKGNVLVILGRFDEAIYCYDEAIANGDDRLGPINNLKNAEAVLQRIGGSDYEVHIPKYEISTRLMTIEVSVSAAVENKSSEMRIFQGNIGNNGNRGGNGLPGGKGFPGTMGFIVKV